MNLIEAEQIADLLNSQNQLTKEITAKQVMRQKEDYSYLNLDGMVLGCVKVTWIQWYQAEISHLSVSPKAQGRGFGKELVEMAEEDAREQGVRIVQCTIREDNPASQAVFASRGFVKTVVFTNARSGNVIGVWQKALI